MKSKKPAKSPQASAKTSPKLRRKNLILAWGLAAFAFALAGSLLAWRYCHHQPAIPQGGAYGATFIPQVVTE